MLLHALHCGPPSGPASRTRPGTRRRALAHALRAEKGSRPSSRAGSEYEEDTASFSTASQKSWGGRNGSSYDLELEEIEDDPFNENVEKLYEKR